MRSFLVAGVVSLMVAVTAAQAPPSASQVAALLQEHYDTVKAFTAAFTQTYQSPATPQQKIERGTVEVKKPGRMNFVTTDPMKKQFVSDGTLMVLWDGGSQATRSPLPHDDASTALMFLSGRANLIRDFSPALPFPQPAAEWQLVLTPKKPQAEFKTLTLFIERNTLTLIGYETIDSGGSRSTTRLSSIKLNATVPDSDFVFKAPKGVKVIDQMKRAVVLLLLAGVCGCASGALEQARNADELRDYDVAVAQYMKVLREHPDNREAQAGLDRSKIIASDAHLLRGRRLFAQGNYDDAVIELQLASDLNPARSDIDRDLRAVRSAIRAKLATPADGPTALQSLLASQSSMRASGTELPSVKLPGTVNFGRDATARAVYLYLAKLANISLTFDSSFRDGPAQVSLLADMTVKQALDAVARSTTTFYQVSGPNTIVVVPDTQAKRREYLDEVLQTFYIQNGDLKEIIDTLRVVGDIRQLSPNTATNAIAVRDTPERVHAAGLLINSIDKAKPETYVDVLILEVDRSRMREYGLQAASSGSTGINGSVGLQDDQQTVASLRSLTEANVLVTGLPTLYYRLLKTDSNTRTLANPHIRISDGTAAIEKFGEEVPVPTVTIGAVSAGGVNTVPIQSNTYRNVGVNLTITPRVHANDDVTLVLNAELSSISGTGFGGFPTFGTRSITTTIRLKDGETGILAGLIRDDDRIVRDGIPGLSDLPAIGHLFAHNQKQRTETDVVLMLTPHIIRVLDLTAEDLRPIRVPRDGSGAAISEGGPLVPPPPIIRGGGPGDDGTVTGGTGRGGRGGGPVKADLVKNRRDRKGGD